MVTYNRVKNNSTTFRYLTGLKLDEFEELIPSFQSAWNNFVYENFIKGRKRERAYGGGNKPNLTDIRDKLVFILAYYRVYPLQVLQGLLFDLHTSNANRWVHRLSPLLKKTLGYEMQLPARNRKTLDDILRECPELEEFIIDGTERKIKKPKDKNKQKENYSGKKKTHTVKNILVTDSQRKVKFLGKTLEGKKHDKKAADEENLSFPEGTHLFSDLGFEGYHPNGILLHHPKKKPKGKALTPLDRESNRLLNSFRVLVEHGIRGVKLSRITQDTYRNYQENFEDELMEVACGLHNYRVTNRLT
ncbi:MAG: transposase [Candidatus Cloacimonetes bacterium]|nr:transposase [Candidatus Cloacimonadota bacterium]